MAIISVLFASLEVKKIMEGHLANINRLAKEGKLTAAGPLDEGGGIFIFRYNYICFDCEY